MAIILRRQPTASTRRVRFAEHEDTLSVAWATLDPQWQSTGATLYLDRIEWEAMGSPTRIAITFEAAPVPPPAKEDQ